VIKQGMQIDTKGTVRSALREGLSQLAKANVPSHALAAELLLMHVLERDRAWLYSHSEEGLNAEVARKFLDLVQQRAAGVPTQYLTGKQEFWGLEFEVTPAVLIPRPETEHVVEVVMERIGQKRRDDNLCVADIGTGSGCVAVVLARELPRARVVGTDISDAALQIAKHNAETHGVFERARFVQCDLLEAAATEEQPFDVIVSNPPYIAQSEESQLQPEVREHEPSQALLGGLTGTEIYPRLIAQSQRHLRPGGLLVLEIGYGARERVRRLLDETVWREIVITDDLAAIPRVISAIRA
jgi:release factor glutamine methyltransferase